MNWASWTLVALFALSFIVLLYQLDEKTPSEVVAWFASLIITVTLIYFSGGWQ